jgi:hypothetical protein
MKTLFKIAVLSLALAAMLFADLQLLGVQLVPEAQAILGVWRRHARRWAVAGTAIAASSAAAASATVANEKQAAAQQQAPATAPAAQPQAAPKAPAAPPPATAGKPLPLGTVVSALPGGCQSTPVGKVEYYYCGGNFYRAVFQGNNLVYVTAQPK